MSEVLEHLRELNLSHYAEQAANCIVEHHTLPSVLYRPALIRDGNQWCAIYGKDLVEGVAGFGDSPEQAMNDFDRNWREKLK